MRLKYLHAGRVEWSAMRGEGLREDGKSGYRAADSVSEEARQHDGNIHRKKDVW